MSLSGSFEELETVDGLAAARVDELASCEISMKHILLLTAPLPLLIVSFPSFTVTVAVPWTHGLDKLGEPLTTSTPSALMRNMPS